MADRKPIVQTDQRLICECCGELGRLIRRDSYWLVTCSGRKPKGVCCQTHLRNTEAEAIEAWQRLHDDQEEVLHVAE